MLELDADVNKETIDFYERDFAKERARLAARLPDDPQDADWIYCELLDKKRAELASVKRVKTGIVKQADGYADRLLGGEPLDYILGNSDFCGIRIKVDERVLIPRFETELLAAEAVKELTGKPDAAALDMCTGSGCIAAYMFGAIEGEFDVITANPPYIKTFDIEGLAPQVTAQPRLALDGDEDGLRFYRLIAEQAKKHIKKGGVLMTEIGFDQANAVTELFADLGECRVIKDLDGKDRIVVCRP